MRDDFTLPLERSLACSLSRQIVLVIRGTRSMKDTLTSLLSSAVPHHALTADGRRLVLG